MEDLSLPSLSINLSSNVDQGTRSEINNPESLTRRYSFRGDPSGRGSSLIGSNRQYTSKIEEAILKSPAPVNLNENEEIEVLGQRGVWANKSEVLNWNGPVPISQYRLNDDPNPEVIHRSFIQPMEYNQDIHVRYLRPPTPPPPGELIIRQENQSLAVPAPPQIIRQYACRPCTPEPVVIREVPPEPPASVCRKVISVTGQQSTELPPRKVIIEKLPPLPPKPPQVIIEKWLPYPKTKRRVVFEGSHYRDCVDRPKNIIVQWDSPQTVIKKGIKYLGVTNADPNEYRARYGHNLKHPSELPHFVLDYDRISKLSPDVPVNYSRELDIEVDKLKLASNRPGLKILTDSVSVSSNQPELYGDLDALRLLDQGTLEREGLVSYKQNYEFNKAPNYSYNSYSSVL